MSYELFRNDVIQNLASVLPPENMTDAVSAVDSAAVNYDIQRKPVSLMVVNGIPEEVKTYIVSRSIKGCSKKSMSLYLYVLNLFFTRVNKPLDEIRANDIRAWLGWYKLYRKVNDNTLNQRRIIINGFFDWCFDNEIINRNPCKPVEPIKYNARHRDPVDIIDIEKMRYACRNVRDKAILDMLYSSGLRCSELCALKKRGY